MGGIGTSFVEVFPLQRQLRPVYTGGVLYLLVPRYAVSRTRKRDFNLSGMLGIGSAVNQINAIVNKQPTFACESLTSMRRTNPRLRCLQQRVRYKLALQFRLVSSSPSRCVERRPQATITLALQLRKPSIGTFPSGKCHCAYHLHVPGFT